MLNHNNLALRTAAHPGRVGTYMHTSTGRKYWPFDPRTNEVEIGAIAHHLATEARYGGATQHPKHRDRIFFSVAEHSVLTSLYVEFDLKEPEHALEALLHDASEAFIGDLIRPLKYDPEFRAPFQKVEVRNETVIGQTFNLIYPYPEAVKKADEAVCAAEVEQIVPKDPSDEWESGKLHDDSVVAKYPIQMLSPYDAKMLFLARFRQIAAKRSQYRELDPRFLVV